MIMRPLVNSRDEPLCGPRGTDSAGTIADFFARLHVIFYDCNLCPAANFMKIGMLQIIVAMIEAERIDAARILEDPVAAVLAWSRDPTLAAAAHTAAGRPTTAVELLGEFWEDARAFVDEGGCEGIVPHAPQILNLVRDTLDKLRAKDWNALTGRLDWVLKLHILLRAMEKHAGLGWDAPQIKHLDHLYSSLEAGEGLFWTYQRNGLVEQVVSPALVDRLIDEPPEDTRAWTRGKLLALAGPDAVAEVDWDRICFRRRTTWGRKPHAPWPWPIPSAGPRPTPPAFPCGRVFGRPPRPAGGGAEVPRRTPTTGRRTRS